MIFLFQSAPPHGGDIDSATASTSRSRFNPRPRTGGDYFTTNYSTSI